MNASREDEDFKDVQVLVVDDEPGVATLVEGVLRDMGIARVYRATDGEEAMEYFKLRAKRIHLVICDWNMPRMTGLEVLRYVRVHHPDLPFLMLTAQATEDAVRDAVRSGVSA